MVLRSVRRLVISLLATVMASSCASSHTVTGAHSPRAAHTTAAATASPRSDPRFASIAEALAFIRARVHVPVVLPHGLPADVSLARHAAYMSVGAGGVRSGVLVLRFGEKGNLIFQFGDAGFDGCGGDGARPVRIGMHIGMVNSFSGKTPWAEVIWPATPKTMHGRYGISGTLTRPQALHLARSMDVGVQAMKRMETGPTPSPQIGC